MGDFAVCRFCGAPIRWEVMASGKRAPLDRDPDPDRGIVLLCDEVDAELLRVAPGRAVQLGARDAIVERARGADLYVPHVATCTRSRTSAPST